MNFTLSDAQRSSQGQARSLGGEFASATPAELLAQSARAGLLGGPADLLTAAVAVEAMAGESASAALAYAIHVGVMLSYDDARLVRGDVVGAMSLSSDEVPALRDGRLSGRASWVGALTDRGVAIVGARQGSDLVACAVALDARGVRIEPLTTAGLAGFPCGHVSFEAAPCDVIGSPRPIMARVRVLLAAAGLGMGRRALEEALQAARAYGRTGAGGEQTVQGLLADAATELDAAALLTWKAALSEPLSLAQASMAKLSATDAAQRAVARTTQVVGSNSFRDGHVVERLAQDVRALELLAGRTEALREAVADEILPSGARERP